MSRQIAFLALLPAIFVGGAQARAQVVSVAVEASKVYVPVGFDDNDEIEVVVEGMLRDTCDRVSTPEVIYIPNARRYIITPMAWRYDNALCLPLPIPFSVTAIIGQASAGNYQVQAFGTAPTPLTVKVSAAVGPDDFAYAPVDSAFVDYEAATGRYHATIRGRFMSTCMAIGEIRVVDSGTTIEVLPILAEASAPCSASETPYTKTFDLPAGIKAGRHLLHVRSLNGKAVNVVFKAYD